MLNRRGPYWSGAVTAPAGTLSAGINLEPIPLDSAMCRGALNTAPKVLTFGAHFGEINRDAAADGLLWGRARCSLNYESGA